MEGSRAVGSLCSLSASPSEGSAAPCYGETLERLSRSSRSASAAAQITKAWSCQCRTATSRSSPSAGTAAAANASLVQVSRFARYPLSGRHLRARSFESIPFTTIMTRRPVEARPEELLCAWLLKIAGRPSGSHAKVPTRQLERLPAAAREESAVETPRSCTHSAALIS